MFWKKPKYIDKELGELTYSSGYWSFEVQTSFGEVYVSLEGDKTGPDNTSLKQSKDILKKLSQYIDESKEYIKNQNIEDFTKGNENLIFDGFHSTKNAGEFDFDFGLSNWDDASITVNYKNSKPNEISLGD